MKFRIASALALAGGLALGATGCSLMAPVATLTPYAPSDGIDVSLPGADVRNLMLIADESGENFNVVFRGINTSDQATDLTISFQGEGSTVATADFTLEQGSTLFGDPEGEEPPVLVTIPDLQPGETVSANFQIAGENEVERQVPVLDGTLLEYQDYVLSPEVVAEDEEAAEEAEGAADADENTGAGEGAETEENTETAE